jgi:tetratricopeptide (TPR) repeat protein
MFPAARLRTLLIGLVFCFRAQSEELPQELVAAQQLIDRGDLRGAAQSVRGYLETHKESADGHYLLGYILFRNQDPKSSIAEYGEGARYRPPGALDMEAIGWDYLLLEDYASADNWLSKSVELDGSDAAARYFLGRAKYNEKRFDEAARAFEECIRLDPKNVKAVDNLGLAFEGLGKTEEALRAYRDAIALEEGGAQNAHPYNASPYLNLGTLLAESDRAAEAVAPLLRAVRTAPDDWRGHRELGKAYFLLNRPEEAQAELEKAESLSSGNPSIHFLLSQVLRRRGLTERSQAETERYAALTGTHSSPETPLAEARSLVEQGKLDDAERILRRFVGTEKSVADGHFLLGYVLFRKQDATASLAEYTEGARYQTPGAADLEAVAGDYVLLKDYPDADKWFTKAVTWNPADSLGWYYLGRTKYNENRFEEAVSAFRKCLELDPRNVKAEDNLGLTYEGLNQTGQAMEAYRNAIAWQSESPVKTSGPYLDLGALLVESGRPAEGLPNLLEAVKMSPDDYVAHRQLGKAYSRLEQFDKAGAELEKAVALAPKNAPVHFMLAQVYRKRGFAEKAKVQEDLYRSLSGTHSTPE